MTKRTGITRAMSLVALAMVALPALADPSGGRVAVQKRIPGVTVPQAEVFVMRADGTDEARLTDTPDNDFAPRWSPDGNRLVFERSGRLHVMKADGSDEMQLTRRGTFNSDPAWSPDGRHIVYVSVRLDDDRSEFLSGIYVMDANGTNKHALIERSADPGHDRPDWSPDGSRILFSQSRSETRYDLYVIDLDGGGLTQLTSHPLPETSGRWSPDGKQIAFIRHDSASNQWNIIVMDSESGDEQVIASHGAVDASLCWSADGSRILYALTGGGRRPNSGFYSVNVDGTDPVSMRFGGVVVANPDAQPALPVDIQIGRTGMRAAAIHPRSSLQLPVILLGSESLDVTDVDTSTLRLGPGRAEPSQRLRRTLIGTHEMADVNGDGHLDRAVSFDLPDAAIACGDESLHLSGETTEGRVLLGSTSIRTVGCVGTSSLRDRLRANSRFGR